MLVYPQFKEAARMELRLRGTPKSLHLATLDLGARDAVELERNCAALAGEVAELSEGGGW